MFNRLNNYHRNTKLTIEVNPSTFLESKVTNSNGAYKFNVFEKKNTKLPSPWIFKTPKRYKQNQSIVTFIIQKEYHQTLMEIFLWKKNHEG